MKTSNTSGKIIKAGLIGAGYISDWHAQTISATSGVEIGAVCDVNPTAAAKLGTRLGVEIFTSVGDLIAAGSCDTVHILTPPVLHKNLAVKCLDAGLHVLVEKPFALRPIDCSAMIKSANLAGRCLAVGHNFLGLPGYERLKQAKQDGTLGRISSAEFNWHFPLAPLRSGPFGMWMLQDPKNLLLELAPHLFAFAVDLFGKPEILHLSLGKPINLPGGSERAQSWRVLARAGDVDLNFNISTVETIDDRSVLLRGSSGMARLDYASDTLVFSRDNAADLVLNPFVQQTTQAWENLREGIFNGGRQLTSLNRKSPYALGFRDMISSFYASIRDGLPVDPRFDGQAAKSVMTAIDSTLKLMPKSTDKRRPARQPKPDPSVLVIGGTGFLGRNLTRALVRSGRHVRVLSRGTSGPFEDIAAQVETVSVSLKDQEGLRVAMRGIESVFNLAKSMDTTWEDCLANDVAVSTGIAKAALHAGVKHFVYTGTIASYDMSDPKNVITEQTGFAADMSDRNLYARSKAACEAELTALAQNQGLPLVIARPGIVIGAGGPLQHWGIGRWHGAGCVRIWGDGRNLLPFVLIDDVSQALIRMIEVPEALEKSFNLTGEPMLSARGYFDAIHQTLGAKIRVKSGFLPGLYIVDGMKYQLKKHLLHREGLTKVSLRDWQSRAHFSPFRNDYSRTVLDWQPEADTDKFIRGAITDANLFGF